MLFTVVESRDARLVAESPDRTLKLTLEGVGADRGMAVGASVMFKYADKLVVAAASGPVAPEVDPFATDKSAFVVGDEMPFAPKIVTVEGTDPVVTTDLSADPLAETVDEG